MHLIFLLYLWDLHWGEWLLAFGLGLSSGIAFLTIRFILRKAKKESEKESRYRNLIDNVSGVIYSTDLTGKIEYASPGVKVLTDYSPDEVTGRHFSFLIDPAFEKRVYDHYNYQVRANIKETSLEFCAITRSGEKKWVEQIALLLYKDSMPIGFQCFVRDISEKKRMQEELEAYEFKLKENQLLLQSILDNTTSLIYVKDLEGKYMIVNRRFLEVFQLTENQVIGHTDHELCPVEQADHYKALDDHVLQTGRSIEIEELVQVGGQHIHLLLTKFPLKDNEQHILGISGVATDITERTHYQQELIAAKVEAEDARKMQEQFLANMSHEIRTPMNGIQGMTNLLLETELTSQQKEFADIIHLSVNNLLVIINDILDFSRIKAGKLTIEKIDFRLRDVIANVQSLFTHRLEKKNILLKIDTDPLIPLSMQGDPHRLNQVLINLVGNAIKFTENGNIQVTVRQEVRRYNEVDLAFTVADSGIGIPVDSLPYIFDNFSQAGLDISRKYGGTGLGLAICHQLLALQGGNITVTSREGEGSTFCFRITYGCEAIRDPNLPIAHSIHDFTGFFTGKHFLVVEDNPVNQKLMDYALHKTGGSVTIANNGQEAIRCLEANSYDLVIMDLQMPVMDGYETTRYMRGHLHLQTPVLAMTANAINGEQIRCLEAGMNDYMSKPFEFKEFYIRIAELLRNPGKVATTNKVSSSGPTYNLSLLEEVGDPEYVQDILSTFLTVLPAQLKELQQANAEKDFDRLFFVSHKLKGSTSMMQAAVLTEKLSEIEGLSKKKADASDMITEVTDLFETLVSLLEKEKNDLTTRI